MRPSPLSNVPTAIERPARSSLTTCCNAASIGVLRRRQFGAWLGRAGRGAGRDAVGAGPRKGRARPRRAAESVQPGPGDGGTGGVAGAAADDTTRGGGGLPLASALARAPAPSTSSSGSRAGQTFALPRAELSANPRPLRRAHDSFEKPTDSRGIGDDHPVGATAKHARLDHARHAPQLVVDRARIRHAVAHPRRR